MEKVLSESQFDSLIIQEFVFHVIEKEKEEPIFLDVVNMEFNENDVMKDWLKEAKMYETHRCSAA